jgi:hypothetical protein
VGRLRDRALRRRSFATVLAAALALAGPAAAGAAPWNGERPPDDPLYDIAEEQPGHSFTEEQWFLYSFIPRSTPFATDPERAAGMSIDRAWGRYGAGRADVRIAYIEGGVNWRKENARRELAPRTYLNTGELPPPQGSPDHDANNDGQVNVADYAGDPRLPPALNVTLTPEDLIVAFSDGTDDDGNGYVDDISGWNFSRGNNDPQTEDSAYVHANNQMMRAAAEGDNAFGEVGICPRCIVIPIKAADEALVRTDRLAQSVYFAVDSGASVVVAVAAELGYSRLMKRALRYAWDHGVVVVLASNDFNSADHQSGMFWPRVWPGNGLVADTTGALASPSTDILTRSFRNRSNYTSFGTHSLFSMPNKGGTTSESTPTQGGVAALMAAFGRRAADEGLIDGRLDAGEIKQVLRAASSPMDRLSGYNYPGKPGATFSWNYGYGRPNVNKALTAVLEDRIPPVPDILGPSWYTLFDPTRTSKVPVKVEISARRAEGFDWEVQWALGYEPTEAEFRTLASRHVHGQRAAGRLAVLKLADVPASFWQRPLANSSDLRSTEQHTITLRVRARDERGVMGEDRRAIAVFHDPALREGFPRRVGLGKESQPVPYDLDGDGDDELVYGDVNGAVHAVDGSGDPLPGWPALTRPLALGLEDTPAGKAGAVPRARDPVVTPPAIGDLDGDGEPEVVAVSTSGRVYVFNVAGRLRAGWPKTIGTAFAGLSVPPPHLPYTRLPSQGAFGPAALMPLPGGSALDVVIGGWDGRVHAYDAAGDYVPGWPVDAALPAAVAPGPPYVHVRDRKLIATPTMADLDGDGDVEVVVKSQEFALANEDLFGIGSHFFVQAFHGDGNLHAGGPLVQGWPVRLPGVIGAYGTAQDWITEGGDAATAADLDGDGRDEVLQPLAFGFPAVIDRDGTVANAARMRRAVPVRLRRVVRLGRRGRERAAARALRRALRLRGGARAVAAATRPAVPVGFTVSGSIARFAGGPAFASGATDLLSLSSLLLPGQRIPIVHGIRVMDPQTLLQRAGFPAPLMGLPFLTAPAVADVSGDRRPDILLASDTSNVAAVGAGGAAVAGWPKFTGGWTMATPGVGDLDGDGDVEVAVTTREGYMLVWETAGRKADVQVPTWHQDAAHTGRYTP